ncbi:MAG: histidinol-phosphate transaminase [Eubacteriales bacterium]
MIRDYLRKDLVDFKPYEPELGSYPIKIDANENPFEQDEKIIDKLNDFLNDTSNLTRYPDTTSKALKEKIAEFWDVKVENIVCGVGSDQIIDCLLKVLIEPGDKIMMPTPSFTMYKHSTVLNHGEPIEFVFNENFEYNIEEIIKQANKVKPKALFLCSPNNPTGNIITNNQIKEILKSVKCPVVVDEAYAEFSDETSISLINKYEQLIVLRTFSKAYGLAGLRVGYAIGNKELMYMIKLGLPPYNLNNFSMYAAMMVLDNYDKFKYNIETLINERERIYKEIQSLNYVEKVYPSKANFLLIKANNKSLSTYLKEKGILVRDFSSHPLLNNCIRVSIGTEEENNVLLKALKCKK